MKSYFYDTLAKLIAIHVFVLTATINVSGQTPVANFSGTPVNGCSPLIVNFTDLSSGNPTSWNWDFGNGNSSTLRNPTATFLTPGTYNIKLTATNVNGSNTMTKNSYITVYEAPTVNFSGTPLTGCYQLTVSFTDLSTAGAGNTNTAWFWDFGNGFTSNLQNPTTTYTNSGGFGVTLRVTNDKGCTKIISRPNYVNVNPGVKAVFTSSTPTVCKAPADIIFTNASTGPGTLSYFWDFGDGNNSAATNPMHTFTTNGSFIVTLITTSSAGCTDTVRHTIDIGNFTTDFTFPAQVCINEPATFTNSSSPVPANSNWFFGDGNNASTINATHSYSAAGTYIVKLINTYSSCVDSVTHNIIVNPQPVADFTAPVTSKCEPNLTVNFQDQSSGSGGPVAWDWDFGDGGTSTLQNPTHTYTVYGSFDVRLIVTGASGCKDTIVKPAFIIVRRAIISIPALPARGCIPYTITMTPTINSVDVINTYEWDFGDGGTSNLPNPTHTYPVQGIYNVRLIITTSTGCTDTLLINQAVKVGSKPVANFSAAPTVVCAHQPVQFTDLSAPADEWDWDFGDGGTSNSRNPSYGYNDTGYFSVTLIAYNVGCGDTITKPLLIQVLPPVARFTFTADCNNRTTFTFTDQSVLPITWSWDFDDATTSNAQNPVHIFPALGSYDVKLVVTNGGCRDSIIQTVQALNEIPDVTANTQTACRRTPVQFHATNINYSNVASYLWDFGDGNTATSSGPDISYSYFWPGNYTITLTITDINGCTNSITKNNFIRINGPVAGFSATNNRGCVGITATFNDLTVPDGINPIVNWHWDFGDGSSQNFNAPPFQHTYNTLDTFDVKLIVTDAVGCIDSLTIVNAAATSDPTVVFAISATLLCPGNTVSFNNDSYPSPLSSFWDFGDGGTSNQTYPLYTYTTPGIYSVTLKITDTNGCTDSLVKPNLVTVDVPGADFNTSDTASSCAPFEVQFTNTSSYYTSSFWDFGPGEGTSQLTSPVHYFTIPGTYQVKLVVTSPGGCQDSITKTVILYDTVGSRINYIPITGCSPLSVDLSAFSPGPMASYLWDFGDGITDTTTTPNITHIYDSYGNFIPRLIMEDPTGCQIALKGFDTLFVVGAKAKFGQNDSLFCDFGTVNFTDSTTFNDPIVSYSWQFGDGNNSNQQNPTHTYNSPGLYTVDLIVTTQNNCIDTFSKTNLVQVVQRPLIDIGGDTTICVHNMIQHTGIFIQPDTSVVTWSWNFPNGASSQVQNPPGQSYSIIGIFPVTAIATNSTGCKDTTVQMIHINPLPTVTMPSQMIIQSGFPVTIPANYSPGVVSWNWTPPTGLNCPTCATPDAGPKFKTTYRVDFTDMNGCTNSGSIVVIVQCKNMNLFIPNTFSPNGDGSNDIFYPRGQGLDRVKSLRIFNRWGEVVYEKRDFNPNDPSQGWDGRFKGRKPIADVYVYQAEVFCESGELIKINGNVALIL